jgi:uncharacterized protein (DUF427 family)
MRAIWKGVTIAESDDTILLEGNHLDGQENRNAAWSYPGPWPWITRIRGHVAF